MATNDKGAKSGAKVTDGAVGELNPEDETDSEREARLAETEPATPARPAKSAKVEQWVEYAVALGADRTFVTEETTHTAWRLNAGRPEEYQLTEPALTRAELIELADRLGG